MLPRLTLLLAAGTFSSWHAAAFVLLRQPAGASRRPLGRSMAATASPSASIDGGDVLPVSTSRLHRRVVCLERSIHARPDFYMLNTQGLVSPAWLEAHLDDPDLAILDIRGEVAKGPVQADGSQVRLQVCVDRSDDPPTMAQSPSDLCQATEYRALQSDYADGHIPGAAFVSWTTDIAEKDANGVPAQLLQPIDRLRSAMEQKGVGLRKRVVVYDSGTHVRVTGLVLYHFLVSQSYPKPHHEQTYNSCLPPACGGPCGWRGTGPSRCWTGAGHAG